MNLWCRPTLRKLHATLKVAKLQVENAGFAGKTRGLGPLSDFKEGRYVITKS